MKRIYLLFTMLLIIPSSLLASAKVLTPTTNQASSSIGGKAPNGDALPINVDGLGNLISSTIEATVATLNFNTTIPSAGATSRTQLGSNVVNQCIFQAPLGNTGIVYAGGSTVTNASGANEGMALIQGSVMGPVPMANTNEMYFAADTANDKIKAFCK